MYLCKPEHFACASLSHLSSLCQNKHAVASIIHKMCIHIKGVEKWINLKFTLQCLHSLLICFSSSLIVGILLMQFKIINIYVYSQFRHFMKFPENFLLLLIVPFSAMSHHVLIMANICLEMKMFLSCRIYKKKVVLNFHPVYVLVSFSVPFYSRVVPFYITSIVTFCYPFLSFFCCVICLKRIIYVFYAETSLSCLLLKFDCFYFSFAFHLSAILNIFYHSHAFLNISRLKVFGSCKS